MRTICTLGLLFFFYGFLGWIVETSYCFLRTKKLVNRGFLVGPICPIYGFGCLFIILLLYRYVEDVVVLFVMSVFICSILEYVTSYLLEKIFKLRWWDYSNRMFNVNGRICLTNLGVFGVLGSIVMYVINPLAMGVLNRFSNVIIYELFGFLFLFFIIDIVVSLKVINGIIDTAKNIKKDSTEEITKKVHEILFKRGGLYARIVQSFNIQATEVLLEKIKKGAMEAKNRLEIEKIKRKNDVIKIKKEISSIKTKIKKR